MVKILYSAISLFVGLFLFGQAATVFINSSSILDGGKDNPSVWTWVLVIAGMMFFGFSSKFSYQAGEEKIFTKHDLKPDRIYVALASIDAQDHVPGYSADRVFITTVLGGENQVRLVVLDERMPKHYRFKVAGSGRDRRIETA